MLNYYQYVNNYSVCVEPPTLIAEGVQPKSTILEDAINITLSQFSPKSSEYITAHRIKDYRKNSHSILRLVPQVDIVFDKILEGSLYYAELLPLQS